MLCRLEVNDVMSESSSIDFWIRWLIVNDITLLDTMTHRQWNHVSIVSLPLLDTMTHRQWHHTPGYDDSSSMTSCLNRLTATSGYDDSSSMTSHSWIRWLIVNDITLEMTHLDFWIWRLIAITFSSTVRVWDVTERGRCHTWKIKRQNYDDDMSKVMLSQGKQPWSVTQLYSGLLGQRCVYNNTESGEREELQVESYQ